MDRKVLIALDQSENAIRAVKFVGEMVGLLPDVEVTLLHVVGKPLFGRRVGIVSEAEWKDFEEKWEQEMVKEMDNVFRLAKEDLTNAGIDPNRIHVKLIPLQKDVALDIISEAKKRGFNTIVVGRKGHSIIAEVFLGSVSNKIVHHAHDCTVWVVE